jgi:hypothetical protein
MAPTVQRESGRSHPAQRVLICESVVDWMHLRANHRRWLQHPTKIFRQPRGLRMCALSASIHSSQILIDVQRHVAISSTVAALRAGFSTAQVATDVHCARRTWRCAASNTIFEVPKCIVLIERTHTAMYSYPKLDHTLGTSHACALCSTVSQSAVGGKTPRADDILVCHRPAVRRATL